MAKKGKIEKLKVKKKSGRIQKFIPEKIKKAILKAGAPKKAAEDVAKTVIATIEKTVKVPVVSFKKIANLVVKELTKKDKKAAQTFEAYFKKKKSKK